MSNSLKSPQVSGLMSQVSDCVKDTRVVAIIRGMAPEICVKLAESYRSGGIRLVEVTFDQTAARAAAKEFFTDASGARQPWLVFQFSTTGTRADSVKVVDSFTLYQAPV